MMQTAKRYADDGCRLTDCCGAYSTFSLDGGDLMCRRCCEYVEAGEGDGSEYLDRDLVATIRAICAREFGGDSSHDFFHLDYLPGESADAALVRLFQAEHRRGSTVEETVLVLCWG